MKKLKEVFINKNYFLLSIGSVGSVVGSQIFIIGMTLWVKITTGSTVLMSLFLSLSFLPEIITLPFSGPIADRISKKKIMISSDMLNGALMIMLFFIIQSSVISASLQVYSAIVIGFCIILVGRFFSPASLSIISEIVEKKDLASAMSTKSFLATTSQIIGQSLGGLLFVYFDFSYLVLINGISFIVSAFIESKISYEEKYQKLDLKLNQLFYTCIDDFKVGLKYVRTQKDMLSFFFGACLNNLFKSSCLAMLAILVYETLKSSEVWYGYLTSAFAFGCAVGGLISRNFKNGSKYNWPFIQLSLYLPGVMFCIIGMTNSLYLIFGLLFIAGVSFTFVGIQALTQMSLTIPQELRGRAFSLLFAITILFNPLGIFVTGYVVEKFIVDVRWVFLFNGVATIALWLALVLRRSVRDFFVNKEVKANYVTV